jgi:hypothetical protein
LPASIDQLTETVIGHDDGAFTQFHRRSKLAASLALNNDQ